MKKPILRLFALLLLGVTSGTLYGAAPPPAEVKNVMPGVYIFQYRGYQSMFVVDPAGVVVTDPISTTTAPVYLAEIRKITQAPIKYVVYSHHHYDHIEGGAVFQEKGTEFVAHRLARVQLDRLKNPAIPLPTKLVNEKMTLKVGKTRVDLHYLGRNHSDNSLVISVPEQKTIYAADWLPVKEIFWRSMFDSYVDEWLDGIDRVLALDWEKLVVSHPRANNPKGWGDKDDIRAMKGYFTDLKEAVRVAHMQGKCPDVAPKEIKLPKYETWVTYNEYLPMNVDRLCLYWRNGWQ